MHRQRNVTLQLVVMFAILLFGVGLLVAASTPTAAQGNNLLVNPSFEGPYSTYDPEPDIPDCPVGVCTTAQMAAGWWPWWVSQSSSDPPWKNRMPEYKPAEAPFLNRVKAGSRAQQYFTFHGTHTAGIFQRVAVPANARLRFTIWGHAWSDAEDSGASIFPTAVNMRIGIDPTGGTNPWSPNIVWSGVANVYDNYALFTVEAQAQGGFVTVFTYSAPSEARKHNDIYWDDAALVVIGGGAPAPVPATGGSTSTGNTAPVAPVALGPTPTPDANGEIAVIVQSGDSLWAIAARHGLTLDELLALNELDRNAFLRIGDRLIVGHAEPPTPEPEETEVVTETAESLAMTEAEPVEEPTATPPPTPGVVQASLAAQSGGTLCFKAYDDANENGVHDAGEALRDAVAITVANNESVVSNYITDGAAEPYCIQGLAAGNYRVTRSVKSGERLTTPGDWAVTLAEGGTLNMEFGSIMGADVVAMANPAEAAAAADAANALAASPAESQASDGTFSGAVVAVVVIAVLLLVGVLVMILSARRSAV